MNLALLFVQKLQDRTVILNRSTLSQSIKEKWEKVLIPDMMSSEDDDDDGGGEAIIIRQLPWRSSTLNDFFLKLDMQAMSQKSSQAKRQMKRRILGSASTHPKPVEKGIPQWAFAANTM